MPIYLYQCGPCSKEFEVVKRVAEIDRPEQCPSCASLDTRRKIIAPMVRGDYEPYNCPITGKRIEGKRQHLENLARHNCRVYEPGETEQYLKGLEERKRKDLERSVDAAVELAARELGFSP